MSRQSLHHELSKFLRGYDYGTTVFVESRLTSYRDLNHAIALSKKCGLHLGVSSICYARFYTFTSLIKVVPRGPFLPSDVAKANELCEMFDVSGERSKNQISESLCTRSTFEELIEDVLIEPKMTSAYIALEKLLFEKVEFGDRIWRDKFSAHNRATEEYARECIEKDLAML